MCYTNILQILDLSKIPLLAKDRTKDDPFVIGGGPCSYNPEPIADFFDIFYIGEGETVYFDLMDAYKEWKKSGNDRVEFLKAAAQIPGMIYLSFMKRSITGTEHLKIFILSWKKHLRLLSNRWNLICRKLIIPKNRSCLTSRSRRTELCLRYSVDV